MIKKLHKFNITAKYTHVQCSFEYVSKDSCGSEGVMIEIKNKIFFKAKEKKKLFGKPPVEKYYNLLNADCIEIEDCGRCE